MELDHYRFEPTFITEHIIPKGLGGENVVRYHSSWHDASVKPETMRLTLSNTEA